MNIEPEEHYCKNPSIFPLSRFHQKGKGNGKQVLIVGESPAANGWRKSGKAFYTPGGKLLPTGRRLNLLLSTVNLSVEECGFTELSKCFIGKNRKNLETCSKLCWPIFIGQLESVNYGLIIILGVKTLEIFNKLNSTNIKIGAITPTKINNKEYRVLGIYHPSPINPTGQKRNEKIFSSIEVRF